VGDLHFGVQNLDLSIDIQSFNEYSRRFDPTSVQASLPETGHNERPPFSGSTNTSDFTGEGPIALGQGAGITTFVCTSYFFARVLLSAQVRV
jgi:hypothetical protein